MLTAADRDLYAVLDAALARFDEQSVLAVTSKIIAICQGRTVPVGEADKETLIEQEADFFIPPDENRYHVALTIKDSILAPNAGIDESNGNGYYVLWPHEPYAVANGVRAYLRQRFSLRRAGVIITDSHTTPLRWGVTGMAIAYSGFQPLKSYIGSEDLFGRELRYSTVNVADALAAAAVLVMGEGDEQTPLAVITDIPFVCFKDRDPTAEEVQRLRIDIEADLYGPLLKSVAWRKGQGVG